MEDREVARQAQGAWANASSARDCRVMLHLGRSISRNLGRRGFTEALTAPSHSYSLARWYVSRLCTLVQVLYLGLAYGGV